MIRQVLLGGLAALGLVGIGLLTLELDRRASTPPQVLYDSPPAGAPRVLWIGDRDGTGAHLPYQVQVYAQNEGRPLFVELLTGRGALTDQLASDQVEAALEQPWDAVVLQEGLQRFVRHPDPTRSALQRFATDHPDAQVFFVEGWAPEDPKLGDLFDPAFVQPYEDRWTCAIHQSHPNLHAVPVGHAIQAHRAAGERVVDYDGYGLAEAGVDIAARMLADALTRGAVASGEVDIDSVCADMPPIRTAWTWARTVRLRTYDGSAALLQDEEHLVAVLQRPSDFYVVEKELEALGRRPDVVVAMGEGPVLDPIDAPMVHWRDLHERDGDVGGLFYRRCGPDCLRFDDVLLTSLDLGWLDKERLLRPDLPGARDLLEQLQPMRPATVVADVFHGPDGAKSLRWLTEFTRQSIAHTESGTSREAFRQDARDQDLYWPYRIDVPYPLTAEPQEAP